MTTPYPKAADEKRRARFVLPDLAEGDPEDMTSFDHLTLSGSAPHLAHHLGEPETTIVAGERYFIRAPGAGVGTDGAGPAQRPGSRPENLRGEQRVHHLGAGEATGLRPGDRLPQPRPSGRGGEEGGLRRPGGPRILAVR